MPKTKDIVGKTFTRLTVIGRDTTRVGGKNSYWLCRCVCGVTKSLSRTSLRGGYAKSCGCLSREAPHRKIDLRGRVFGFLTVIAEDPSRVDGHSRWLCRCVCGDTKSVNSNHLLCNRTVSCGCRRAKLIGTANRTHGQSSTRLYRIWAKMRQRCQNPNDPAYAHYGGRGIRVDPRWESFEKFAADVGPAPSNRHSIDRYPNNDGNYEPGNVRWATAQEQALNTRSNHRLTRGGVTKTIVEWARDTGIKAQTIKTRLSLGWSDAKTLTTPPKSPKRTWSRKKKV